MTNVRGLAPLLLLAVVAEACTGDDAAAPATPASAPIASPTVEPGRDDAVDERMRVIVDYSPTPSDVAALMYVTQHPGADLVAVTLAGTGESRCAAAVANTRGLLAAVGRADVPVACGVDQPLGSGNEWPADWRDAADRLDGLDRPGAAPETNPGADAADLLASAAAGGSPITIIALAPLTNLAAAIERHPELAGQVAGVVTMGGAVAVEGNAPNSVAEWNYYIDPTAVDVVLRSGIPLTMVPLDATNAVPVTKAWFGKLAGHRTTIAADVVHDLFAATRPFEFGFFFWDELAAATAFDRTLVTFDDQPITIDLDGAEQGRTRVDAAGTTVRVAVNADSGRFEADLLATLNGGAAAPEVRTASNEEAAYFTAVEQAAADLSAAVEMIFQTPLADELEEIERRAESAELTAGDEETLRAFFTDFWIGADEHLRVLRDALARLDPPASVEHEHDGYATAVDAVLEAKDDRLADIATREAGELLTILWEPDDTIDAMNAACAALSAAASRIGLDAETCLQ